MEEYLKNNPLFPNSVEGLQEEARRVQDISKNNNKNHSGGIKLWHVGVISLVSVTAGYAVGSAVKGTVSTTAISWL